MFSTLPILAHNLHQAGHYAPQVSSPLSSSSLRLSTISSRDGNIPQSPQLRFQMSSPTPPKNWKDNPYSKRVPRPNPLIHNRDDTRETRRELFLKKVRKNSEDRRWDARGGEDEMMRTIWIAEEKRRADRLAKEAEYVRASEEEEEELKKDRREESPSGTAQSRDDDIVDEVALQEEAELEALLSMMEAEHKVDLQESYYGSETLYGSDDEEYEHIFLDVINEENRFENKEDTCKTDRDMMDIS